MSIAFGYCEMFYSTVQFSIFSPISEVQNYPEHIYYIYNLKPFKHSEYEKELLLNKKYIN